jgi:hypothetical protein
MKNKMTRRQLAGVILTAAAAVGAQTAPSVPSNPAEELEAARGQNRRTSEALAKVPLPMGTEPAFHFTA